VCLNTVRSSSHQLSDHLVLWFKFFQKCRSRFFGRWPTSYSNSWRRRSSFEGEDFCKSDFENIDIFKRQVAYAGVNRPDLLQRQGSIDSFTYPPTTDLVVYCDRKGKYDPPRGHSTVLGLEVSGTVVATGAGVDPRRLAVGDKVCTIRRIRPNSR
jgi:hypothetical protein